MRSMVVLLGAVLCALVAGEARAQADGGFYVSQELDVNLTPTLEIDVDAPGGQHLR